MSRNHIQFITEFAKMGFMFARNSSMKMDDFIKILDEVTIPKTLLQQVGNDYFLCSLEPFRGGFCSFQIDAGQINQKSILVFMLTSHQRRKRPMIFDLVQNFGGDKKDYCDCLKSAVEKASQYDIEIVGLVTDNLPVQIKAYSQNSQQNFRTIFHDENFQKIIQWYFKKKIPQICQTRWYSAFHTLQKIFENRKDLIELFKNPPNSLIKDLKEIHDDFRYLIETGFTLVYPLLFPYLKLTYHLQNDELSCVHAILIIEHYLQEMKENIAKFNIPQSGYDLINLIKKRLCLHKNVQLYQLASLFTPDGIVRYRSKMKGQYNITENDDFWHNKEGFLSTHLNLMFPDINSYKKNELDSFIEILNQFQFIVPKRKLKRKRKAKKRISRILKNPVIKSFPPQTQLSIKKYIEKAYDFYRKKN